MDNIADKLITLKNYTGIDEVVTSLDMAQLIEKQPQGIVYKSKIPSLDRYVEYFETGELVIIGGPRKSGKTLLGQTLTVNFKEQGASSLWFSFELSSRHFLQRFPSYPDVPFFVMPKSLKAYALDWLEDRIVEAIAKYGISIVYIDHLHYLFDMAKVRNSSIEIGQIVRYLRRLAIELNIVIFVMCHMNKFDPKDEPSDENFRDSSFVAQESHLGVVIWRVRNTDNKAILKICYHTRTGTLDKKVRLIKVHGLLKEETEEDED